MLSEKADNLEQAEARVCDIWARWEGGTFDGVIDYPDDFSVRDLDRELENAIKAQSANVASAAFGKELQKKIADAAPVILEELQHALDRGAHIYAEITGFGNTFVGGKKHPEDVRVRRVENAMQDAIENARIKKEDVDFISANANGCKIQDAVEAKAIQSFFGTSSNHIPISAIKSNVGSLMALQALSRLFPLRCPSIQVSYPTSSITATKIQKLI